MAGEVPKYPKNRPSHFAHKLVRLMVRTCAAQEMGPNACLLVVAIAHTEHAKWYTGPVTFWNDQLCSVLAFNSWGQLDRARKRAIATGWLHYKPGGKGKVGKYWTAIPAQFSGLPDGPVDEDFAFILSTGGEANGLSSPPVVKETGEKSVILSTSGERTEGQAGDKRGTNGEHSNLRPKPKPKEASLAEKSADHEYSDEFKTFWKVVLAAAPHKVVKKAEAFRRYKQAVRKIQKRGVEDPHAFLRDRAKAYYFSPEGQTQFANGPAPWLYQGRYDDDPAAWKQKDAESTPKAPRLNYTE